MKYDRKQLTTILQGYPAMRNALKNLNEQIKAEAEVVKIWRSRSAKGSAADAALIDEHLFRIEDLQLKKHLLQTRMRAITRSLRALSEEERAMLEAFYMQPYDRDRPFELMDRFGYEKTQLYVRRGQALNHFGAYLNGEIPSE